MTAALGPALDGVCEYIATDSPTTTIRSGAYAASASANASTNGAADVGIPAAEIAHRLILRPPRPATGGVELPREPAGFICRGCGCVTPAAAGS